VTGLVLALWQQAVDDSAAQEAAAPVSSGGTPEWLLLLVGIGVVAVLAFGVSRLMRGGGARESRETFSGFSPRTDDPPARPTPEPTPEPFSTRAGPPKPRQTSIFISYRREDSADITGRISDRLIQKFGRDAVFKDVESIPLGSDFRKHLKEAVGRCDVLVAVIGRKWTTIENESGRRRLDDPRDHLRIEVESALERDIPVIPVLVQGAVVPDEDALPEPLRPLAYRNAQPVRPDPDFNHDLERLMSGIEAHISRR
jgi:hypothetical protein